MGRKSTNKASEQRAEDSGLELTKLVAKRERIKEQLERFRDFLSTIHSSQVDELEIRTVRIESLLEPFEEIQIEIEMLDVDEKGSQEGVHFERDFYQLLASAKKHIATFRANQISQNNSGLFNSVVSGGARLPNLGLPKFRGDFEKWTQFFETFQTLVHNNQSLDEIQKFYYLLDCLEGDARKMLDCLEITRTNYGVALNLLEKRFQNKPVIIQKHLKALVDMPSLGKQSAYFLRNLNDNIEKHVRALKALGEPVDTWDRLLIFLMSRKLDVDTKKYWEEKTISDFNGVPKLTDFLNLLSNKCRILETVEINNRGLETNNRGLIRAPRVIQPMQGNPKGAYSVTEASKVRCEVCKGSHFVYYCEKLLELSVLERTREIRRLKLCYNCLRSSHMASECRSDGCKKCQKRHNTLLHPDRPAPGSEAAGVESVSVEKGRMNSHTTLQDGTAHACLNASDSSPEDQSVALTSCNSKKRSNQVILSTAVIYIKDKDNNFVKCRALLDNGSQMNFISWELVKGLNLETQKIDIPISGVNQMLTSIKYRTQSTIKSCYNEFRADLSFLVLEKITGNIPIESFEISSLSVPSKLKLADPDFNISSKIDILIGADLFFNLLCVGQIRLGKNQPLLQKSVFGWIISGKLTENPLSKSGRLGASCHLLVNQDINKQLERFWVVEEVDAKNYYSKEEAECEQHFLDTVTGDKSGRFTVALPCKNNIDRLGESLEDASNRFHSLEKKLLKNPALRERYCAFMEEYISLGHMTEIELENVQGIHQVSYIPHHGVINEASSTTKLRVVFDASAKTSSGLSLNDVLKVGPRIQDDLFDILLRFRQHNVVITADICKMYRQVNVLDEQRDLQRVLWRSDPKLKLGHYRLNTVTYGTGPASFLATRCLQQIADDIRDRLPEISKIITRHFYVDDLILSIDSADRAVEVGKLVTGELSKYGFPLRKWSSNRKEVLDSLLHDEGISEGYFITDSDCKKTLGVFWLADPDVLEYVVQTNHPKQQRVTKRLILSITAQIFDPLGLVGPVTVRAKILLQKLWQLKLDWDEAIPLELFSVWSEFYGQLSSLNDIRIPRQCTILDAIGFQMHGFCDASDSSYGACLYLRSVNNSGEVLVRLVCAKSKVAPIKNISLPRLELCGAVLPARLTKKVMTALDIRIDQTYLWTDSTIVLAWLAEEPNRWKVFVANRVSEIQGLTQGYQWGHVVSNENPADIISRGVHPKQLRALDLWWNGPAWLKNTSDRWSKGIPVEVDVVPERRDVKLTFLNIIPDSTIFERYSTLFKLVRILALCQRFFRNVRNKPLDRKIGKITVDESDSALLIAIRLMQTQVFNAEIQCLRKSKPLLKQSSIISLDPFLDDSGTLRVGGRIRNSDQKYDFKFPIILAPKHPLTNLIILDQHHKHLHAGPQAILAALRQRYWPVNGRSAVRSVLSKCITRFRIKPYSLRQKMGDLPKDRVSSQRPFLICGVDFAGPFNLKDGKLKNRAIVKAYMCIFVCFCTKAVHIEIVGDLSASSFLNCLKRFVSRRGLCVRIYSANATNFVGANNELNRVGELLSKLGDDDKFHNFCLQSHIDWQYIPPRSPHHGGLWESAVKAAKHHITRIVGNETLTFEAMSTLFAQVEAVLNSRPLTPLSCDPNDLLPLTPGHVLIGDSLTAIPQLKVIDKPLNRLDKYHLIQKMYQQFWFRWSSEYLSLLQQRSKWHQSHETIQLGALVVLKEENTAPLNWKLGRVVALHPGKDQVTRVASVRTSAGTFKRAIQKLCVLPIETLKLDNCT